MVVVYFNIIVTEILILFYFIKCVWANGLLNSIGNCLMDYQFQKATGQNISSNKLRLNQQLQQSFKMYLREVRDQFMNQKRKIKNKQQKQKNIGIRTKLVIENYNQIIRNPGTSLCQILKSPIIIQNVDLTLDVTQTQFVIFVRQTYKQLEQKDIKTYLRLLLSMVKLLKQINSGGQFYDIMETILDDFDLSIQWIMMFCELSQKSPSIRDIMFQFTLEFIQEKNQVCVLQLFPSIIMSILYYPVTLPSYIQIIERQLLPSMEYYRKYDIQAYIKCYICVLQANIQEWNDQFKSTRFMQDWEQITKDKVIISSMMELLALGVKITNVDNVAQSIIRTLQNSKQKIPITTICKFVTNLLECQTNRYLFQLMSQSTFFRYLIDEFGEFSYINCRQDNILLFQVLHRLTLEGHIQNWMNLTIIDKLYEMSDISNIKHDILELLCCLVGLDRKVTTILRTRGWKQKLQKMAFQNLSKSSKKMCEILIQKIDLCLDE